MYASQATAFTGLGALWKQDFNVAGRGESVRLQGARVSADFFSTMKIDPVRGRLFTHEEDRPGGASVAIISAGLWNSRFGASPETVGSNLIIDGQPFTIVGIVPGPFVFTRECCDLWVPRVFEPDTFPRSAIQMGAGYLTVIGRLRPGFDTARATADLRAISRVYAAEHPGNVDAKFGPKVEPLADQVVGDARDTLMVLLLAGALVFLISAANVGNLLLTHYVAQSEELAVQRALGAQWYHLTLPMVTECVLLALASVAVALVVAIGTLAWIRTSNPTVIPYWDSTGIDANVLLFALVLVIIASVVAGVLPALRATLSSRPRMLAPTQPRGAIARRGDRRWLRACAVAQLALSFTLLAAAAEVWRTMRRLEHVDAGYEPGALLTAQIAPTPKAYPDVTAQSRFYRRLRERLLEISGVADVGLSQTLPVIGNQRIPFHVAGRSVSQEEEHPVAQFRVVDVGYFHAMGIPLRRGRTFSETDTRETTSVIVISESLARRQFPDRDPLREQIVLGTTAPRQVIGIVGDVRELGAAAEPQPGVYIPLPQMFGTRLPPMYIVVRAALDPASLAETVRRATLSVDPDQPLARVRPMRDIVDEGLAVTRLRALLAAAFAATGILLAAIGVASVLSHIAVTRTREFGVHLALGASPASVVMTMLRTTLALIGVGVSAGFVGALALMHVLQLFLGNVIVTEPGPIAFSAAVIAISAAVATILPAVRLLRIDPVRALGMR
jgi:predicted permease